MHANLTSSVFLYPVKKVFALLQSLPNKKTQQSETISRQFRRDVSRASPPRSRQPQSTVSNTGKSTLTPCTSARTFTTRPPSYSTTRRRCRITTATRGMLTTTGSQPLRHTKTIAAAILLTSIITNHLRITIRMTAIASPIVHIHLAI